MHFLCLDLPDVVLFYFFKERGNGWRASSLGNCLTAKAVHQL